nr:hypothetical protein Iba_chr15cCG6490 [Ipomoea batatas]
MPPSTPRAAAAHHGRLSQATAERGKLPRRHSVQPLIAYDDGERRPPFAVNPPSCGSRLAEKLAEERNAAGVLRRCLTEGRYPPDRPCPHRHRQFLAASSLTVPPSTPRAAAANLVVLSQATADGEVASSPPVARSPSRKRRSRKLARCRHCRALFAGGNMRSCTRGSRGEALQAALTPNAAASCLAGEEGAMEVEREMARRDKGRVGCCMLLLRGC